MSHRASEFANQRLVWFGLVLKKVEQTQRFVYLFIRSFLLFIMNLYTRYIDFLI